MRKAILVLASVALAVLLASGIAFAATVKGDGNDNVLTGTPNRDVINPFGGNDTVYALGGNDDVRHSYDNDKIWGGSGRDLIDCAYLESRDKGEDYDTAHAVLGQDTVVDCKTVVYDDTTTDTTRLAP